MSERIVDERASATPVPGQVGGQAVMLIPSAGLSAHLGVVRQAAGPVRVRQPACDMLGVDVGVRGELEPLFGKLVRHAAAWRGLPQA